jgi:hypothetical protein
MVRCVTSLSFTASGALALLVFSSFIASFHKYRNPKIELHPPPCLITDASWWADQLLVPGFTRSLIPFGYLRDLDISVNASTDWGIGIIWGEGWDAWRGRDGWKGPWRDIGWLECLALLHLEAKGFRSCRIRVRSDNQGIIGLYYKLEGRSRDVEINFSIRRFMSILDSLHILLVVEYIRSEDNPADPVSRGVLGPKESQLSPNYQAP